MKLRTIVSVFLVASACRAEEQGAQKELADGAKAVSLVLRDKARRGY